VHGGGEWSSRHESRPRERQGSTAGSRSRKRRLPIQSAPNPAASKTPHSPATSPEKSVSPTRKSQATPGKGNGTRDVCRGRGKTIMCSCSLKKKGSPLSNYNRGKPCDFFGVLMARLKFLRHKRADPLHGDSGNPPYREEPGHGIVRSRSRETHSSLLPPHRIRVYSNKGGLHFPRTYRHTRTLVDRRFSGRRGAEHPNDDQKREIIPRNVGAKKVLSLLLKKGRGGLLQWVDANQGDGTLRQGSPAGYRVSVALQGTPGTASPGKKRQG